MSVRTPRKTIAGSPLVRSAASQRLAGRASDSFLAQRPPQHAHDSPQSPSTPYHQFAAAQRHRLYANGQPQSSSPFAIAADNSALSQDEHGSNSSSPAFRKGAVHGFVSGVRPRASVGPMIVTVRGTGGGQPAAQDDAGASGSTGAKEQQRKASPQKQRYVRQVPLSQKLKQWPVDTINTLWLRYMVDFSPTVLIYEKAPTLPLILGAILHMLSLLACVILNPGTPVSTQGLIRQGANVVAGAANAGLGSGAGKGSLFRPKGGRAAGSKSSSPPPVAQFPEGALPDLRSLARSRQENWMRWTSILLTLSLLAISAGIAYTLFTTTRTYRFWLRNQSEKLRSSRAKLVPLALDEDVEPPPFKERVQEWILNKLRAVPILGWFLGPELVPESAGSTMIYRLDSWSPPTMLLKLFCIYSPLHAFLWALSSPLFPSTSSAASASLLTRFFALVLWPAVHIAVSAQLYALVHFFEMLVQDQTLIQSEVIHEYDQKFVLPKAMPMMRDASTMTNQAETFEYAREFRGGLALPASLTRSHQSVPNLRRHRELADAGSSRAIEEEEEGDEDGEAQQAADSSFGSDVIASPSIRKHRATIASLPPSSSASRVGMVRKQSRLRTAVPSEDDNDGEDEEVNGEENETEDDREDDEEEAEEDEDEPVAMSNVFQSSAKAKGRTGSATRRR